MTQLPRGQATWFGFEKSGVRHLPSVSAHKSINLLGRVGEERTWVSPLHAIWIYQRTIPSGGNAQPVSFGYSTVGMQRVSSPSRIDEDGMSINPRYPEAHQSNRPP